MAINLTLPGLRAPKMPPAPPPPEAPPPPPTQVDAKAAMAGKNFGSLYAANIKNKGGAQGLSTAATQKALKALTGQ